MPFAITGLEKADKLRQQSHSNYVLPTRKRTRAPTSSTALTVNTKRLFNVTKPSPVSATSLVVT
jgi:hypothetical protein